MKTRNSQWLDTNTLRPLFGVQVLKDGVWINAMLNGEPILCETEQERDEKRARVKKALRGES